MSLFDDALKAEGVSGQLASLARSIYAQESGGGKNTKTSHAGARGGMQIIPSTFASVADKDWSIDEPIHNLRAGIRYLKQLDTLSGGDPKLTAAGYYGGPRGMEKAKRGVAVSDPKNPKAPTTLQYADQVVARMEGTSPSLQSQEPVPTPVPVADRFPAAPAPVFTASGYTPLPQELVAALAPRRAAAPVSSDADEWAKFLKAMPQARQPINVADLDYANPQSQVVTPPAHRAPLPMQSLVPHFAAFSAFGKKA